MSTAASDGVLEVPWNLVVPEADVFIVGYGNRLPNDFTLEMLAVLRRCKRIFAVPASMRLRSGSRIWRA